MAQTPRGPAPGPPPEDEYAQLQRRLNEQVLERAAADPEWRRRLIEDPQTAMADIPEAGRLREMYESAKPPPEEMEVVGHASPRCPPICFWYTYYVPPDWTWQ